MCEIVPKTKATAANVTNTFLGIFSPPFLFHTKKLPFLPAEICRKKGHLDTKSKVFNLIDDASQQIAVVNYESVWRIEPQIKNCELDMIICYKLQRYVL